MDVFQFLKGQKSKEDQVFDYIVIDPPFTESLAHATLGALSETKLMQAGTQIAIESNQKERIDEAYPGLRRKTLKEYGDKFLSLYEKLETLDG